MANVCTTKFTFYTETKEGVSQLRAFHSALRVIQTSHLTFDMVLSTFCGKNDHYAYNGKNVDCGGYIEEICGLERSDDETTANFEIVTQSRWTPAVNMWKLILSSPAYNQIKFVYIAEEQGNELFINSDVDHRFYTDKYHLDCARPAIIHPCYFVKTNLTDDGETAEIEGNEEYFDDDASLLEYLNKVLIEMKSAYEKYPDKFVNVPDPSLISSATTVEDATRIFNEFSRPSIVDDEYEPYLTISKYEVLSEESEY